MLRSRVAKFRFQSSSVAVAAGSQANGGDLAVEYKIVVVWSEYSVGGKKQNSKIQNTDVLDVVV